MDNVFDLKPKGGPESARKLLRETAEDDSIDGVVVITLHKGGYPKVAKAYVSPMEMTYLAAILQFKATEGLFE